MAGEDKSQVLSESLYTQQRNMLLFERRDRMLFSSIPFLYYFLPAVVLCYFLAPRALKNTVLLLFSLVFYAWGEPKYVFLMIGTILMFWGTGWAIGAAKQQFWRRFWLIHQKIPKKN